MENNLIYQCHTGKMKPYIALSSQHFIDYADKYNVDYIMDFRRHLDKEYNFSFTLPNGDNIYELPYFYEKIRLFFDDSFDEYDKIVYVDSDILINDWSENIFDIPIDGIAMVQDLDLKHFNTGVIITTKAFRQSVRNLFEQNWMKWIHEQPVKRFCLLTDEYYLNHLLTFHNINVTMLEQKWNIWYRDRARYKEHTFYHFSNDDKKYIEKFYFNKMELE